MSNRARTSKTPTTPTTPKTKNTILGYFSKSGTRKTGESPAATTSQPQLLPSSTPEPHSKRDLLETPTRTKTEPSSARKRCFRIESSDDETEETENQDAGAKRVKKTDNSFIDNDEELSLVVTAASPLQPIRFQNNAIGSPKPVKSAKKSIETPNESFSFSIKNEEENVALCLEKKFVHETLDFLRADKIMDKNRRKMTDAGYDPRTLYVPETFIKKVTPAMKQWWALKVDYFDCILLFKVGKFYESFHMDAVKVVQVLGICFTRGETARAGFPEQAYPKMCEILVDHGLKVARIEQTETVEMKAKRVNKSKLDGSFNSSSASPSTATSSATSKLISRELCEISTKGVRINSFLSPDNMMCFSSYMIAIKEQVVGERLKFAVCIVDTNLSEFHLTFLDDDLFCSNLLTVFAHYQPSLFLLEKNGLSKTTKKILNDFFNVKQEFLVPVQQFYCSQKTEANLRDERYFKSVPEFFAELEQSHNANQYTMLLESLGACMFYLKYCLVDVQVLSAAKFFTFNPKNTNNETQKFMIIDNCTVEGLSLFGPKTTLQAKIDQCGTAFGKRLLRNWIAKPFMDVAQIGDIHDAVKELVEFGSENPHSINDWLKRTFSKFIDFDRTKQRIMTHLFRRKNFDHPDNRAVFFEEKLFNKKQIISLVNFVKGLRSAVKFIESFSECGFESRLLKRFSLEPTGEFPDIRSDLDHFEQAFNLRNATETGAIVPDEETSSAYKILLDEKRKLEHTLTSILKQIQDEYCSRAALQRNDKGILVTFPIAFNRYRLPDTFVYKGETKTLSKYSYEKFDEIFAKTELLQDKIQDVLKNYEKDVIEEFTTKMSKWEKISNILAQLDVLFSYYQFYCCNRDSVCSPSVTGNKVSSVPVTNGDKFSLAINSLAQKLPTKKMEKYQALLLLDEKLIDFILQTNHLKLIDSIPPYCSDFSRFQKNDIEMGTIDPASGKKKSNFFLLCGPNMSGKSTILRQTGLNVILSQIGSYVAASESDVSRVDRIFTRIGARDDIVGGASTFSVELNEMKTILENATQSSLLLIDEFGNGTSSHDGTALAIACMTFIKKIRCRTFFSTHFKQVLNHFENDPDIEIKRMAYVANDDDENREKKGAEKITFLYKLENGDIIKSYAFNVSAMVGLDQATIDYGHAKAQYFERKESNYRTYRELCKLLA